MYNIFHLNFISDRTLIETTYTAMPSKERSKSAPPSRSREKIAGQGRNEEDEPRSGNRSSDFEDEDVFEESGGGFKWSDLRISLYRKNTIDNMKKRIIELQEENQGLRNEIEVKIQSYFFLFPKRQFF